MPDNEQLTKLRWSALVSWKNHINNLVDMYALTFFWKEYSMSSHSDVELKCIFMVSSFPSLPKNSMAVQNPVMVTLGRCRNTKYTIGLFRQHYDEYGM
jgi:hypothetical protein